MVQFICGILKKKKKSNFNRNRERKVDPRDWGDKEMRLI